jgi:resolvase-like protein
MTKITTEHLARRACVYIRQSTADQLAHNHESRRRQYGLVDRAKQLGWSNVDVIDDDLGRSGGGIARPGFERLLATICDGCVGAVLAIEASRLARNGRDWHTLIEFCGLVGTLIVDEDGIYDPRHPNDRLLLGMKGTMSAQAHSAADQTRLLMTPTPLIDHRPRINRSRRPSTGNARARAKPLILPILEPQTSCSEAPPARRPPCSQPERSPLPLLSKLITPVAAAESP